MHQLLPLCLVFLHKTSGRRGCGRAGNDRRPEVGTPAGLERGVEVRGDPKSGARVLRLLLKNAKTKQMRKDSSKAK